LRTNAAILQVKKSTTRGEVYSGVDQEGIGIAFLANGGQRSVPGLHDSLIGQLHQLAEKRVPDLVHRTAPQIGAANAAREKCVTCKKSGGRQGDCSRVLGKVKGDTSRRVARSVDDFGFEGAPPQRVTLFQELVDLRDFRRGNAEKRSLHFHALIKRQVIAMHQDGCAGVLPQLAETADVIDVGMSADDGLDRKAVPTQQFQNAGHLVAGVNHQGFSSKRISNDRAIALQHADRNGDVDESLRDGVERRHGVSHSFRVYHSHASIQERGKYEQQHTLLSW